MKPTPQEEAAARIIAKSRGVSPDDAVLIQQADGTGKEFNPGWQGYVPMARQIIKALSRGKT